jgi:hypothetical protein
MRTVSRVSKPAIPILLVGIALLAEVASARAATVYVAVNGIDGASCGASTSPCRSITQAIDNAVANDTIIVGPGTYRGESGAPNCSCFVAVNKLGLKLLSSGGAAATVIDALAWQTNTNVLIIADKSEFGRPGKGFTVTEPDRAGGTGIAIDAKDVKIRGNQVLNLANGLNTGGVGIATIESNAGPMLIAQNQVVGWDEGIAAGGTNRTVAQNAVAIGANVGIELTGASTAKGNVVSEFKYALRASSDSILTGNALLASFVGVEAIDPFIGTVVHNDIVGDVCGLANNNTGLPSITATNNYWGAPTGPGPAPADSVCDGGAVTTPFASAPITVRTRIKP